MRADTGSLYDAHADRLYAYCWSLVGDQLAAAALGDTFAAAVHRPPRGDGVLWLYSLARSVCTDRGAFTPPSLSGTNGMTFADPDPLLRAAAALPTDHREALLLWAGEWLETPDIARLLGVAPDTAAQLVETARARLERAVLDILMRGTTEPRLDLITAFEKGKLPRLLARRAPANAPGWLRDRVVAACEDEAARDVPTVTAPIPLVVIGDGGPGRTAADRHRGPGPRGRSGLLTKGLGAAAGVAASAAAVIGLLVSWPSAKGAGSSSATIVPSAGEARTQPASVSPNSAGGAPAAAEEDGPSSVTSPYDDSKQPAGSGGAGAPAAPGGSDGGSSGGSGGGGKEKKDEPAASTSAPEKSPSDEREKTSESPSPSDTPSDTPSETPSTTPETTPPDESGSPSTPPDTGSDSPPPSQTPTQPETQPPAGTPSPTSNPAPNPG